MRIFLSALLGLSIATIGAICFAIAPQVTLQLELAGCGFAILWPMISMALVPLGGLAFVVCAGK